jgi:hypothetical protein
VSGLGQRFSIIALHEATCAERARTGRRLEALEPLRGESRAAAWRRWAAESRTIATGDEVPVDSHRAAHI